MMNDKILDQVFPSAPSPAIQPPPLPFTSVTLPLQGPPDNSSAPRYQYPLQHPTVSPSAPLSVETNREISPLKPNAMSVEAPIFRWGPVRDLLLLRQVCSLMQRSINELICRWQLKSHSKPNMERSKRSGLKKS